MRRLALACGRMRGGDQFGVGWIAARRVHEPHRDGPIEHLINVRLHPLGLIQACAATLGPLHDLDDMLDLDLIGVKPADHWKRIIG